MPWAWLAGFRVVTRNQPTPTCWAWCAPRAISTRPSGFPGRVPILGRPRAGHRGRPDLPRHDEFLQVPAQQPGLGGIAARIEVSGITADAGRTVLIHASALIQIAGWAAACLIALVVAFQVALATGTRWGAAAYGAGSWRARANCRPDTG
jgi:hypothetical protein